MTKALLPLLYGLYAFIELYTILSFLYWRYLNKIQDYLKVSFS